MNDEVYFWNADKHRSLLQVDTIILGVCTTRHAQSTQNKFAYLCISPEAWGEVHFLLANKHEGFLQVDNTVSVRVCLARHAQTTHNINFTVSL